VLFRSYGMFWSSSEYLPTHALFRTLFNYNNTVSVNGNGKKIGLSVRCLQDN
jgi:uncharacterized protein (TIGR02145 family)